MWNIGFEQMHGSERRASFRLLFTGIMYVKYIPISNTAHKLRNNSFYALIIKSAIHFGVVEQLSFRLPVGTTIIDIIFLGGRGICTAFGQRFADHPDTYRRSSGQHEQCTSGEM